MTFEVQNRPQQGLYRAGEIITSYGVIETPAFVAVATKATVKGVDSAQFSALGIQTVIANTYHLYLSGLDAVEKAGGVGKFMSFPGPTMTDSGGFQVFSLGAGLGENINKFGSDSTKIYSSILENTRIGSGRAISIYDEDLATSHGKLAIVDEEGVSFTSHIDGSLQRFTPERSIEIQHRLGADIIFAFDECTSPTAGYDYQKEAMDRTHRWAHRSLMTHNQLKPLDSARGKRQMLFGIVQGGRYEDLRIESANTIAEMDFDGFGIGGSFSKEDILGILDKVNRELPEDKPRHLLGIGEPEDIFIGVAAGIDTFDCVLPTRNGRGGTVYTRQGKISMKTPAYAQDLAPIDPECGCPVCQKHSRAYLHHLFRTNEMFGPLLASMHNLYFISHLISDIRTSILEERFEKFRDEFLSRYRQLR